MKWPCWRILTCLLCFRCSRHVGLLLILEQTKAISLCLRDFGLSLLFAGRLLSLILIWVLLLRHVGLRSSERPRDSSSCKIVPFPQLLCLACTLFYFFMILIIAWHSATCQFFAFLCLLHQNGRSMRTVFYVSPPAVSLTTRTVSNTTSK